MIGNTDYKILSIDTSCDETSAAVTENIYILSNTVWSQASLHAKFGGVMPSLAQREHQSRIDWVISKALLNAKCQMIDIDAIAVTVGPGLAIALGVGIDKAKELSEKYHKPLIQVNHLEGHLLSCLAKPKSEISKSGFLISKQINNLTFPALGLVVSGGNTQLVLVERIGKYKVLAETQDDALGEALDKAARMLGLGYPGGAILEKFARKGSPESYKLPVPLAGQEDRQIFSYSGLKTAFFRLIEKNTINPSAGKVDKSLSKNQIYNLATSYQNTAFSHLIRVSSYVICHLPNSTKYLFIGGGVAANNELRRRIRKMCREFSITPLFPYTKKLFGDNAAMVGIAAYLKAQKKEFITPEKIDRIPNFRIG